MKKLIALICVLAVVSLAFASNQKIEVARELGKCAMKNCESQMNAARALFKAEMDGCLKTCNASGKKLSLFADEELKDLKSCFQANNCKMPLEHLKQNAATPQVRALKTCTDANCKDLMAKLRKLAVGGSA